MELTAGEKRLVEVKIQRGSFEGDSLSSLLFVISMIPLSYIRRKSTGGYKITKSLEKFNQLKYMDQITLCVKTEKELDTLT